MDIIHDMTKWAVHLCEKLPFACKNGTLIPLFVLNNHFPVTSGAKFGSVSGSPSHNPFHVVGMAQAQHFSEGFLPQTNSDFYLFFGKAVFRLAPYTI